MTGFCQTAKKWLRKQNFHFITRVVGEALTDGASLLENIRISHPDILLLDVLLSNLDLRTVLKTLGSLRYPPYVIVTAPRYDPYLAQVERYRVVKGTLLHGLATSPLLVPVLRGIAEGHEHFTPEASLNFLLSDLTLEDTILLALMAIGQQASDLMRELDRSINVVYIVQSRLRKKLGVETNEQAILVAIRRNLVGMFTEPNARERAKEIA